MLPIEKIGLPDFLNDNPPLDSVINRMFKETAVGRDQFGGDGVFLQPTENNAFILHRIQLKMGVKVIKVEEARSIIEKINRDGLLEIYKSKGYNIAKEVKYLATTKEMMPDAKEELEKSGIKIFNARDLRDKVWPKPVKDLGGVFGKSPGT